MRAKTMEGLIGARTNIEQTNTPMRVFRDARRRGDTAVMERAMEYVDDFSDQAKEYQEKAEKGMKEDQEDARKRAETDQAKAIEKRKEERRELEERLEKKKADSKDTVVVSGEGKVLLKENSDGESPDAEKDGTEIKEPVIYTKTGEALQTGQAEQSVKVSVSV